MAELTQQERKLYDEEGLIQDFKESAKNHKQTPQLKAVMDNLEHHTKELRIRLKNNTFTEKTHKTSVVQESSCRKKRNIQKPWFLYEQPAHHALIRVLKPIFMREMYYLSCGSIEERGPHHGKKYVERWIKEDPANCKYFLKFDIRHFFESVPHRKLKKMLKRKIRDRELLKKIFSVIDSCKVGLPIGYYTSQWFGNFYLTPLDHFIKEKLHAVHMVRYMDDVVIFGRNKKELHNMRREIDRYLTEELGLQMKGDWQVCRFDYVDRKGKRRGRPLDFMGFKFYRDKTTLRKGNLYRTRRKINKVKRKGKVTWKDAASILSRLGWFKHTETYNYYLKYIKPYIVVKNLKQLISKHTRKEQQKNEMVKSRKQHKTGRS